MRGGIIPVHQPLAPDLEGTIGAMERHLLAAGVHTNFVKFHRLAGS